MVCKVTKVENDLWIKILNSSLFHLPERRARKWTKWWSICFARPDGWKSCNSTVSRKGLVSDFVSN